MSKTELSNMTAIPILSPVRKPDGTILSYITGDVHETENKMSIPKNNDMKLPDTKTTGNDSISPRHTIEPDNEIKLYPRGTLYPLERTSTESENAGQIAGPEFNKSSGGRSGPPSKAVRSRRNYRMRWQIL
jgi:hypothetical protein